MKKKLEKLRMRLLMLSPSVDLRWLAISRIGMGLFLLLDLIDRLCDFRVFYTNQGVWKFTSPQAFVSENGWLSFHAWSSEPWYQGVLFGLGLLFALSLTLGYRTRASSFLSWLFFLSLHSEAAFLGYPADQLLRMTIFWGIFTPWGERYSLDGPGSGGRAESQNHSKSFGSFSFYFAAAFGIFLAGASKNGSDWADGSALYHMLTRMELKTGYGDFLLAYPSLMVVLAKSARLIELLSLLFFFSPFFSSTLRTLGVLSVSAVLLTIRITLQTQYLTPITILMLIPLLPGDLWDWLSASLKGIAKRSRFSISRWLNWFPGVVRRVRRSTPPSRSVGPFLSSICVVAFLVHGYMEVSRVSTFFGGPAFPLFEGVRKAAAYIRLDNNVRFFYSPKSIWDGWVSFPGETLTGEKIDLWTLKAPSSSPPENFTRGGRSFRWRRFAALGLFTDWDGDNLLAVKKGIVRYLCNEWKLRDDVPKLKEVSLVRIRLYHPESQGGEMRWEPTVVIREVCTTDGKESPGGT